MSSNIDERVVKLSFDNKKFEKNVNQSISTLDKFNDQLRFDNVSDGTARVEASFSAMEVAIFTVINRITNRIIDLGVQLVRSLSVDNITTGWDKFSQKTTSVATLAAQNIKIAGKSIDDYGRRMDVVNEQLQKLNWFTDETSYNFTDMVDNIGKFTAAGRDLDESVKAMEGIATWASLSGQNAATASRAMYQLAQALGKGNVQLIDWRSIQNANMDTQEFRQTVLDTAVSIGQLTKEGENYITKAGTKFNINQFTEQLSSKWFTSDVLIKSLDKYSSAVEQVYEIAQREGITATEVIQKYGDQLDAFGLKAFRSAQEAKTLADAMNSVKDAVSTGWMNTAEKIFGSYDESKVLWSELADQLYDVFAEGGNFRNQVLGLWKDLGGRANLFGEHGSSNQGAFWNVYDSIVAVKDLITETWNSIFSNNQFTSANDKAKAAADSFKQLTENIQAFTKRVKDTIKNSTQLRMILTWIFSAIKLGIYTLQAIRYAIDPIIDAVKDLGKYLFNKVAAFTTNLNKVEKITDSINKVAMSVHDTLASLIEIINPAGTLDSFLSFLGNIKDAFVQLDLVGTVKNVFSSFFDGLTAGGGTIENVQKIIKGLASILSIIGKTLVNVSGILDKYILPVISSVLDILSTMIGFVSGLLVNLLSIVGEFFTSLDDIFKTGGTSVSTFGSQILDFVKSLPAKLQKLTPILASLGRVVAALIDIIALIPKALDNISKRLTGKGIIENISGLFDSIAKAVESFRDQMASGDSSKVSNGLLGALGNFVNSLINVLGSLIKVLTPLINLASKALDLLATLFNKIADGFNYILSLIDGAPISSVVVKTLAIVGGIVALIAALSLIYNIIYTCTAFTRKISYAITVMSDGVEEFLASFKFKAIAEMIESIGTMLLSFAVSFAIIASLPINGIIKASAVIGSFILIISALAITLVVLTKAMTPLKTSVTLFDKKNKKFLESNGARSIFSSMAEFLNSISKALLRLAIAAAIMTELDTTKLWHSTAVLLVFMTAITIMLSVLQAISNKAVEGNKDLLTAAKSEQRLGKSLKAMAGTFVFVALAMKVMSKIDIGLLWNSVGVIAVVFVVFTAFTVIIGRFANLGADKTFFQATKSGLTLVKETQTMVKVLNSLSKMLLSLSASLLIISSINDPGKIWNAAGVVVAILAAYTICIIAMEHFNNSVSHAPFDAIAKTLNAMSLSMLSITVAVGFLSLIKDPKKVAQGVIAIGVVIAAMSFMVARLNKMATNNNDNSKEIVKIMKGMSATLLSISLVMLIMSTMQIDKMLSAAGSVVALFLALSVLLTTMNKITGSKEKTKAITAMLTLLAINLATFGASMLLLARTPWQNILAGCLGMSAVLLAFSGSVMIISKSKNLKGNAFKMAALLSALALNLVAFGTSMMLLSNIPWQNILVACLGMSAVLLALSAATMLMSSGSFKDIVSLSAGMTLLGLSLIVLSLGLVSLRTVGWTTIAKGAVLLAGSLVILGAVSKLLGGVTPVMLAISASVLILGGGMLMAAVALQMFSAGLGSFAESMVTNVEVIGQALSTIGPVLIEAMVDGFKTLLENVTTILPTISTFIIELVNNILDVLNNTAPQIISTLANIFVSLLQTIADNIQPILDSVWTIISSVMAFLLSKTTQIIKFLVDFIIQAIEGLTASMSKFIKTLTKFIIAFINAFFDNIGKVVDALLNRLIDFLQIVIPKLVELLLDFIKTLGTAIIALVSGAMIVAINLLGTLGSLALDFLAGLILLMVHISVGLGNVLFEAFRTLMYNVFKVLNRVLQAIAEDIPTLLGAGVKALLGGVLTLIGNLLNQFVCGLFGLGDLLKGWGADLAKQADDAFDKDILSGKNVINALDEARSNIHNTMGNITGRISEDARNGVSNINKAITDSIDLVKTEQKSNMKDAGYNVGEGFNEGVEDSYENAYDAGSGLGDSASSGVRDSLDIHSPSRVMASIGRFLVQGFANGITDNASVAENSITSMMNSAISGIQNAIDGDQNTDIVIRPVMDLSDVRAGSQSISSLMSNINGSSARVSVSGSLASSIQSSINRKSLRDSEIQNGQTINNAGDTYNPVFNITSNNPNEVANEVNIRLQKMRAQAALAKGGAR